MVIETATVLVLLGAGEMTQAPLLRERLLRAVELTQAFPKASLWVIGNNVSARETDAMIQFLEPRVSKQRLLRIDDAMNTRESFEKLRERIPQNSKATVAIATNDFHLPRSHATARLFQFSVVDHPFQTQLYDQVSLRLRLILWFRERASGVKFFFQNLR